MSSTVKCFQVPELYRNTLKKDPCEVAFDVLSNPKCSTNSISANQLHSTLETIVGSPQVPQPNPCFCSTPLYNLVSFCSSCQRFNKGRVSWEDWSASCTQPGESNIRSRASVNYLAIPDTAILADAHVQKWANEPGLYNETGFFDRAKADSILALGTDEFPSPSESGGPTIDIPSPTVTLPMPTQSSSKQGPNVGAIAGGVIGGVVLLAAIGLLFLCWRRRKNRVKEAPSAAYIRARGGQLSPAGRDTPVPMVAQTPYVGGGSSAAEEKARLAEHEREREREESAILAASSGRQGTHSATDSGSFDTPLISNERRHQHLGSSEDNHTPPSFKSREYELQEV